MNADDFVSEVPVEQTVTIAGVDRKLHFREVSDQDWYRYIAALQSDSIDVQAGARAFLISKSLCEPDGKPALTLEKAAQLKIRVAKAIHDAAILAFKTGKEEAGNASEPGAPTGSGTS